MNNSAINEALNALKQAKTILKEDYGFDDEYIDTEDYTEGLDNEVEEDDENVISSSQDERITQIREIALAGLQEYSHNVDCEEYQFFKKIWLMCDKAVSDKESVGNTNN